MSRRRSTEMKSSRPDRLRPVGLGCAVALIVATPMVPTETVLLGGSVMVLMLLWFVLLFAWALSGLIRGSFSVRGGPMLGVLAAFLVWHTISALVMADSGIPRAALNVLFLWLNFGVAFFLARQWLQTAAERRAMVAVMIAIAACLATVGFYQYFYDLPKTRALFQKDPDSVLRQAGIYAPPGTPMRKLFADRLASTEPMATFALTNSLAGFLAPWLIASLGIAVTNWKPLAESWRTRYAAVGVILLIAGCWMLTKSRTAWLATFGGIVLLAIYARRSGWRPDWRIVAGGGAAIGLLPLFGMVVGGLDRLIVLESSKSLLYRAQYWRATAAMIADHPWFGCGPGNFQQYYTAYKLPAASETIAEPHNFFFEIWATAGTPAIGLFLGALVCAAWQIGQGRESRAVIADRPNKPLDEFGSVRAVYWGALAGAPGGFFLCGLMEGYLPTWGVVVPGIIPVAVGTVVLWHPWVRDGQLPISVTSIAVVVLLVNLLAAGGISFASVALGLWLLLAIALNEAESRVSPMEVKVGRLLGLAIAAFTLLLLVMFHQTTYSPTNESQTLLTEGTTRGMLGQRPAALSSFRRAAQVDPYSPVPWEHLAQAAHDDWMRAGDFASQDAFAQAAREILARNPRSSHVHSQQGNWWLAGYRRFGKQEHLQGAIKAYRIAVQLYPNYNLGHAQLAWALHLAGNPEAASAAATALKLDDLNPHQEQKLARQKLEDPPSALAGQPAAAGERSAEQIMQALRSSVAPR